MTSQDINTLLSLLIPFFLVIFLIIGFFLFKTRKQKLPREQYSINTGPIDFNLTDRLAEKLSVNIKLLRLMPLIVLLFIDIFVIGMITIGQGPDGIQEITDPSSGLFKVSLMLICLSCIGAWLAHIRMRYTLDIREKSIELAKGKKLIFKISEEGITIPTIILVNPSFWRATEKNLHELFIPFADVDAVEVFAKAGNAPSQFLIKTMNASSSWGESALGEGGPYFGVGFRRVFHTEEEKKILSFFQDKLGDKLIIRDNSIT